MKQFTHKTVMRLLAGFLFLITYQTALSQQLKKLEYAFNSDPGVGNGIAINLPSVQTIDSTFNLNVSSLPTGIHRLFFRVQDMADNWSMTQTTSFFKFPGNDTAATITQLEYFLDSDPGFGNGSQIALTPGNIVSDTFTFNIPDNGANTRTLYVRGKDNRGAWGLLYKRTVNMCQIYKAIPDFDFVHFGNRYTFSDSTRNELSNYYLWKFFNNNILVGTSSISHPQIDLPPGMNTVRLIRGTGCRQDSIERPVTTGKISDYFPKYGEAGGDIIIVLYGAGLDTNASVFLKPTSNPGASLIPTKKISHTRQQLFTYFDLHHITVTDTVSYFIEVVFSGGGRDTVPFSIVPADASDPDIIVHINGPVNIRGNISTTFNITLTNTGNKFAAGVPLWVAIPDYVNIDFTAIPTQVPAYYSQELKDSVKTFVVIDSIDGKPNRGKVYCILLTGINAGQTISVPVKLLSPLASAPDFKLYAWTSQRMFGSALKYFWGKCFDDLYFLIAGFIPAVGCVTGAYDFLSNGIVQIFGGEQSYNSLGSWAWGVGSALISCIPGGTVISKYKTIEKIVEAYTKGHHVIDGGLNVYNQGGSGLEDCAKTYRDLFGEKNIQVGLPRDPNEIYGPEGFGPQRYIANTGKVGYTVSFENVASATASAQRVYVLDTLDKTKFDLANFELATLTISDSVYFIPPSLKEYTQSVKIKEFNNVDVLANIKLDTATGILSCTYLSIDPVTKELIDTASLLGFLPPNISPPEGQGSISYSVKIRNSLPSGTTVPNRAAIVFDKNNSISTDTWVNTIDNTAPAISGLTATLFNDTTIRLLFSSSDLHSGVNGHRVFMSVNNGSFQYICYAGTDSLLFIGQSDSLYTFYAIPVDNVGNVGSSSSDAAIKLPPAALQEENIRIFPNPGRNVFHIRIKVPEAQNISVTLYNTSGQLVKNIYNNNTSGIVTINTDLSNLNSGVYIIQVNGNKGFKLTDKLVIAW